MSAPRGEWGGHDYFDTAGTAATPRPQRARTNRAGGRRRRDPARALYSSRPSPAGRVPGARGPPALVHGNRGRRSPRRLDDALRDRIVTLATTTYAGANHLHFQELLAEREGVHVSYTSLRRMLHDAGLQSPKRRRTRRHRRRRERMPRAGMLLQVDGSVHDWLEGRGPWLTLLAVVDDARDRAHRRIS